MQPNSPAQRVAAEVRAALARQSKSHRFVGETLGLSQASVSRRMRGEIPFDVEELHRLATALAVPVEQFLSTSAGAA